ncbi:hypothetical protein MRB53_035525 [Persea americana]|uniref:Uncharacterized protein n=2 Tax=Persea americana TaxID=3435 RepID=A0ACC2K4V9_PERAE|nr:hypothetical protein MRB53_035521 [Persea americana]KAJ8616153.1 hypothetical protein MRB53_035525 [Persea americana]
MATAIGHYNIGHCITIDTHGGVDNSCKLGIKRKGSGAKSDMTLLRLGLEINVIEANFVTRTNQATAATRTEDDEALVFMLECQRSPYKK